MANLPHKAAYEACNPDVILISEVQVSEDEGIKLVTLRQYSHASIKAAVGTRLDPVCKDEEVSAGTSAKTSRRGRSSAPKLRRDAAATCNSHTAATAANHHT